MTTTNLPASDERDLDADPWALLQEARRQRDEAIQSAYKMGDELRDELRLDLKEAKAYARAVEEKFIQRVTQLQTQLNATQAELRVVKRMRCPRDDCPVFVKDDPVPAE